MGRGFGRIPRKSCCSKLWTSRTRRDLSTRHLSRIAWSDAGPSEPGRTTLWRFKMERATREWMWWERTTNWAYCLQRVHDGWYAVLNRRYKPVGSPSHEWLSPNEYEALLKARAVPLCLTPDDAQRLSCRGKSDLETIWLYNDGCIPTEGPEHQAAYDERRALLAELLRWKAPYRSGSESTVDCVRALDRLLGLG